MTFAHVAVDVPARAGTLFSYAVPPGMKVVPGTVVIVPFSSRILPGMVVCVDSSAPDFPTKRLLAVVDGAPCIAPYRVAVAGWIADYYRDSLFEALRLFLPPGWRRAIAPSQPRDASDRRWTFTWPQSPLAADTMLTLPSGETVPSELPPCTTASRTPPCGGGQAPALQGGAALALVQEAGLSPTPPPGPTGAPRKKASVRARILALLADRGPLPASTVLSETGCSLATLRSMVKSRLLTAHHSSLITHSPTHPLSPSPRPLPPDRVVLNPLQTTAFAPVAVALESHAHQVFLLHGVTGSGKTHIYFRLIETAIRTGRRAIVLVSEIAQTPEALRRYAEWFPGRVAILHSAMPPDKRAELWRGIYEGRFDVVVGPRSALFAPIPNLGLIVMDEEHEPSYKQDDITPRYHARDVAIELGRQAQAPVVLGSATPEVSSYYLATRGVYQFLTLPERYAGPTSRGPSSGRLPDVSIVDLRGELRTGNTSILSRLLQNGIQRTLDREEQSILFLNRRGASTAVVCRDCGHVITCGRCDVALVYHKATASMLCHQCNRETSLPEKCPKCKGRRISYFGAGTERVEEEVRKLFPTARVLRWDHDVAVQKGGHERIHEQFRRHEADVLVGTQMIAKALDFPLVTLVGIVLADVTLHLPDFRAAERTFQLLSQVAGRAGRGEAEGRVIIQTYSPDHYAIVAAARHDYLGFYEQEMEFRRHHSYPPFRRMARLLFTGTGEARARYEALQLKKRLQETVAEEGIPDVELLGPAPAFHSKIRSRWRWQLVVTGDGTPRLLSEVDLPRGWTVDVDPVSLL